MDVFRCAGAVRQSLAVRHWQSVSHWLRQSLAVRQSLAWLSNSPLRTAQNTNPCTFSRPSFPWMP